MRYLVILDNNGTIRLDALTIEKAINLATAVSPAIQNRTAKIAEVRAVGSRAISDGWQAEAAA
jgi:hypothetical protein